MQSLRSELESSPDTSSFYLRGAAVEPERQDSTNNALRAMGFTNVKVLIQGNFGMDWVEKGFPVPRETQGTERSLAEVGGLKKKKTVCGLTLILVIVAGALFCDPW